MRRAFKVLVANAHCAHARAQARRAQRPRQRAPVLQALVWDSAVCAARVLHCVFRIARASWPTWVTQIAFPDQRARRCSRPPTDCSLPPRPPPPPPR